MKKKVLTLILLIGFCFLLPSNVSASKATCTYRYGQLNLDITYTYEYGAKLKYTTSNDNKTISSNPLSNNDFVDQQTGEISCPKLSFTSKTVSKGKWKVTVKKDTTNGTAGTLNMLVSDDKEKNSPSSNNTYCTYYANNNSYYEYTLSWNNRIIVNLTGNNLNGYTYETRNCDEQDFKNGCPAVYDQLTAKAKKLIIDCKSPILTDNDQQNEHQSSTNVDTGQTTPNSGGFEDNDIESGDKNNVNTGLTTEEIKDMFKGKISCGGITNFTFPTMIPRVTSTVYNILKIAVPVILIIMGMLDMFKATTAGKEDEMKKAQKRFGQRLIAGICALLVFLIIEIVINFIADKTNNSGAMDCVNCFINGQDYCDSASNSPLTCPAGYTQVGKVCLQLNNQFYELADNTQCDTNSGWTIIETSANEFNACMKISVAQQDGEPALSATSFNCNNGLCQLGSFKFKVTTNQSEASSQASAVEITDNTGDGDKFWVIDCSVNGNNC